MSSLGKVYSTARKDAVFPNIVCVHGFGAQSEATTWHHPDTGKTWIKDADFMEHLDGSCRVFSFEFNAAISANLSAAGILFHAHDLLIALDSAIRGGDIGTIFFVAHSWGGIIIKKAIHLAWMQPAFTSVKESLAGLFFLGTPHVYHDMSVILQAVRTTVALHRTEDDDIPESDVRLYAAAVRQINEIFFRCRPSSVFTASFWELNPTPIDSDSESLVISTSSKVAEVDDGLDSTMECTHAELARFPTTADPRFRRLILALNHVIVRTMAHENLRVFSNLPNPLPDSSNPDERPLSPPPTPPTEEPDKPLSDPTNWLDDRIVYWKRKTEQEDTHLQRTNFLRSLRGWTELNTGSHLAVAPGTCSWILQDPAFSFWRRDPECGTMFIIGEAACGKSHLAKDVANRLKAVNTSDIVMSYHCTPGERPAIWEYFTWYLVNQDSAWFDEVPAQYRCRDIDSAPLSIAAFTEIWNAFRALSTSETIYMIIDGLEQCGDVAFEEFFEGIRKLRLPIVRASHSAARTKATKPSLPTKLKVVFTCRSTLTTDLASARLTYTAINPKNTMEDIVDYVLSLGGPNDFGDGKTVKVEEQELRVIKEGIMRHAKAYWPYATFALEQIQRTLLQGKQVRIDSEHNMPVGLKAWLHDKIMVRLRNAELNQHARTVVTFMASAPSTGFFPIAHIEDMLRVFASANTETYDVIAALTRDWGDLIQIGSDDKRLTGFLHESITHVIRSLLPEQQRHLNTAFVCINYLLHEEFAGALHSHEFDHSLIVESFLQKHPFYGVAASIVLEAVQSSGALAPQLMPFLRAFFDPECPQYRTWCIWADWNYERFRDESFFENPIVLQFVLGGCVNVLEHLLPLPGVALVSRPRNLGFFSNLVGNKEPEGSFLEAADWPETCTGTGLTALMVAIMSGELSVVNFVLQYNPNVNARSEFGITPLLLCLLTAQKENDAWLLHLVEQLLRRGADVNAFNASTGWTPLCYAAKLGNVDLVRMLLSYGANVHMSGIGARPPLELACESEDAATFAEIIDWGADVGIVWSGNTLPIVECMLTDRLEMFSIILPLCDVNRSDGEGKTPLHYACHARIRVEYLRLLLEHPDIDVDALEHYPRTKAYSRPFNALAYAASGGRYKAVEMLLNAGADPGRLPGMKVSPLILSISHHVDIAKLLLSFNAPVNDHVFSSGPRTALGVAVRYKNEDMVLTLLEHGADPTIENAYGWLGPLAIAVGAPKEPNMRIVEMLLSARIPADANACFHETPLLCEVAGRGSVELVRLLLDNGADLGAWLEPHQFLSPLVVATDDGHLDICELLLDRVPRLLNIQFKELGNCDTPLLVAAQKGHADAIRLLLEKGASPDLLSSVYNESPLLAACEFGDIECVKLLLEAAPEMVNIPNAMGMMPLTEACNGGHFDVMKTLLEAGADFIKKDHFGDACVGVGLFSSDKRPEKVIGLLMQYGLDINAPHDTEGRTVLYMAISKGKARHVRWLLEHGADPLRCLRPPRAENSWANALMAMIERSDPDILDLLLEPEWGLLDHLGDITDVGQSVLSLKGDLRIFDAIDKYRFEKGKDLLSALLERPDVYGRVPIDLVFGDLAIRPSAYSAVKEFIIKKTNQVFDLPNYDRNEHQQLVSSIAYDLLHLGGYDAKAVKLLTHVTTTSRVDQNDEGRYEELTAMTRCMVCHEFIKDVAMACRFCRWLRCHACRSSAEGKGKHECEMVEVPILIDESFDLKKTLQAVATDLQPSETASQPIENPETQYIESLAVKPSPEEAHLQSTLNLATLHAFNLLAIRRPLFTPYLDLAPSVQDLIAPWKDMISEQRRYWETDNMEFEWH